MLKDTLKEDQKQALKAGDAAKRTLIGVLLSSIKNKEVEKRTKLSKTIADPAQLDAESQLNDEEVIEVIGSEIKKRKDSITEFEKGGRPELAAGEQQEIDILMGYMPEQLSDEALKQIVQEAVAATGATSAKDMGKVIGAVMPKVKGKAEGTRVSALVKELLG